MKWLCPSSNGYPNKDSIGTLGLGIPVTLTTSTFLISNFFFGQYVRPKAIFEII